MALDFFEIERGLLLNGATHLVGAGAPSGSGDSATVGIGSTYQDSTSGELYVKKIAGAGAGNWTRLALSSEISMGTSWREPARVADLTTTTIPTETPTNPILVDGVSIVDGDRVLFAALTGGGGKNVYVYNQAAGTFTEDTNTETVGDSVYVGEGTSAGKSFFYNGTIWVQTNQSSLDEEGFIRAFVGKSAAGNVLPTYSSQNYIANGDSLQTAVGKLDTRAKTNADNIATEIGDRANADSAIQGELNTTQTGAGLNANGTYSPDAGADYISTATSLKNADSLLDDQIKVNTDAISAVTSTANNAAAAVAKARTESVANAVTAAVTVDSVLVDDVEAVKWVVYCAGSGGGDLTKKQVVEILATHDGSSGSDATATDYNVYAKLKMGTIPGLEFSVDVSGVGAAQAMRLRVTSTMSVNVQAIREVIV
jgi:hypothetical protein